MRSLAAFGRSAAPRWHALRRRRIDRPLPSGDISPPSWVRPDHPLPGEVDGPGPADAGEIVAFARAMIPSRRADGQIDWHTDPLTGVAWPADTVLSPAALRGATRPGDVKQVWEPARFLHAFDAACAGAERADALADDIDGFLRQVRWRLGPHWDNGLEAALRGLSWTFADGVLGRAPTARWSALRPRLVAALGWHARFIREALDPAGYNHLVGDAGGLAVIGTSYPDLADASTARSLGMRWLLDSVSRQVLADGSHIERAPAYARFVADLYLVAALALRARHPEEAGALVTAAERLIGALVTQATPHGDLPAIGDDDGAMAVWSCHAGQRLAVSAALLAAVRGRADFKHLVRLAGASSRARRVVAALLGPAQLAEFDALAPNAPSPRGAVLPDGGAAVWRSSWQPDATWVLFRCGPVGVGNGAHAHMDQLSVLFESAAARLVDPGTPTYNGDDALRASATGTAAHSALCLDGASPAERTGRFSWSHLPEAALLEAEESDDGWHARGRLVYRASTGEAVLTRQVEVRERELVLRDTARVGGEHRAGLTLLFDGARTVGGRADEIALADGSRLTLSFRGWSEARAVAATHWPVYADARPALRLTLDAAFRDGFEAMVAVRHDP